MDCKQCKILPSMVDNCSRVKNNSELTNELSVRKLRQQRPASAIKSHYFAALKYFGELKTLAVCEQGDLYKIAASWEQTNLFKIDAVANHVVVRLRYDRIFDFEQSIEQIQVVQIAAIVQSRPPLEPVDQVIVGGLGNAFQIFV